MILAVSRFRVANGMEDQVRAAFIDRPGLVDSALGFLGMETFTDKSDATIFYLVTRWSDVESFHTWHHSQAHHDSHRFIPKGLKLDGTYTQVLELERIEPARTPLDVITTDASSLLFRFIKESRALHLIAAGSDGTILKVNAAVVQRMQLSVEEIEGSSLWSHLTEFDGEMLRGKVGRSERLLRETLVLNFLDRNGAPYSIVCKLEVLPDSFVIVGEPPIEKDEALREEYLTLNNELAVLSRENARKKRDLERVLGELKEAQAMMVQQEKMASLGQMTAGVAHEINNPIAFVLSNHESLLSDFQKLLSLINLFGDSLDELSKTSTPLYELVMSKVHQIELPHLIESIPRKLSHNLEGLERIKNIVLDLRSFSRLDDDSVKPSDINEGITSTLRFLSPLIDDQHVAIKTVLSEIPPLTCSPGKLNQVFSNIILNALQASTSGGEIVLSTSNEEGFCVVKVTDNGEGIATENLTKVFDPFFTTKPVGSGTGLGLHIARQIVTAHRGEIRIESARELGTTVIVRIPYSNGRSGEQNKTQLVDAGEQPWNN